MDIINNPWQVESVQAFLALKCPECVFTSKEEHLFQDHAIRLSADLRQKVNKSK